MNYKCVYECPPEFADEYAYLEYLVKEKVCQRYVNGLSDNKIRERVEMELATIKQRNAVSYFLIMQDSVNWAKSQKIPVGPGRNNVTCSIVAYILGITGIDPLAYDLLFERFLNPELANAPEITIDVSEVGRGQLIKYIADKYKTDPSSMERNIWEIKDLDRIRELDGKKIPLNDEKTFEIFKQGDTTDVFQFESSEMRKYLKELKPDRFEDLIAIHALSRPGIEENIPKFIRCKHGLEQINYYHKDCEKVLGETYGNIVYMEQFMHIVQILSGFSLGKADIVRRAMGKSNSEELLKIKPEFITNGVKKGYSEQFLQEVWGELMLVSHYTFGKNVSVGCAYIAYQMAYIKVHFFP